MKTCIHTFTEGICEKWASNETQLEFKLGLGSSGGIMDNWSEEEINALIHIHLFKDTYVEKWKMKNFTCNFKWFLPRWEISHLQFGPEDSIGSFAHIKWKDVNIAFTVPNIKDLLKSYVKPFRGSIKDW